MHGRLTKDELDTRAGLALSARTCADLAALTADIPGASAAPWSAAPWSARPTAPASRLSRKNKVADVTVVAGSPIGPRKDER